MPAMIMFTRKPESYKLQHKFICENNENLKPKQPEKNANQNAKEKQKKQK